MKVINIFISITILSIVLQMFITIRCIRYIKKNYEKSDKRDIVIKYLVKDGIKVILISCIPGLNIIMALGLLMMAVLDNAQKNLVAMGFMFKECKFKQ